MKIIKGDLILTENYSIDENLTVEGNIICQGGKWNIICGNIICGNITCGNITCGNIICGNIICWDITCGNIICWDITCGNINYFAVAFAYESFKCKSIKGRRCKSKHFCLDSEIEYKPKVCDKCGQEIRK